jgi:hypothetical protein
LRQQVVALPFDVLLLTQPRREFTELADVLVDGRRRPKERFRNLRRSLRVQRLPDALAELPARRLQLPFQRGDTGERGGAVHPLPLQLPRQAAHLRRGAAGLRGPLGAGELLQLLGHLLQPPSFALDPHGGLARRGRRQGETRDEDRGQRRQAHRQQRPARSARPGRPQPRARQRVPGGRRGVAQHLVGQRRRGDPSGGQVQRGAHPLPQPQLRVGDARGGGQIPHRQHSARQRQQE